MFNISHVFILCWSVTVIKLMMMMKVLLSILPAQETEPPVLLHVKTRPRHLHPARDIILMVNVKPPGSLPNDMLLQGMGIEQQAETTLSRMHFLRLGGGKEREVPYQ